VLIDFRFLWVVTPGSEDGGSMALRNVGILPQRRYNPEDLDFIVELYLQFSLTSKVFRYALSSMLCF
jgi:hypothetical protein